MCVICKSFFIQLSMEGISMFHVQRTEMISKTFRLPEALVNQLSAVAQQQGVSVNNLVAQCCAYALAHLDEPTKETGETKA